MRKPFMEMDLDDFDEVSDEGMDFDFDEDTLSEEDTTERKTITVIPQEKVGDVSFGMNRDEVRNIFGDYTEFNKTRMSKSTTDDFGFCHVFYNNNKCEAIELFDTVDVVVDGTPIFSSDVSVVKSLFPDLKENGDGLISKDSSVGICISDGKIKSILFGCKGYMDDSTEPTSSGESTRAQFKDKAYFDEYITTQRERIEKISSEPNSSSESGERMLGNMYMDLISAEYSDGMSKEEISTDVNDMFSHIKTVDSYGAMVDYLSLAILFNISNDKISSILSNDQYDDDLVSKLKDALGSTASGEGVKYENYQTFDDMLNNKISSEEFLNYVNNNWYDDSKDRYWYDSHNSSENTYTGYWCWVGAAVAQIKNIDTNGSKYIPSELISSTPTQESYVQEAFGATIAKEWIKKPEVIKEINDGIDQQFTSFFPSGIKPSEADLVENRKKILAKNIEPHILMSMYAKKSFDEMLKEEQRLEEEKMRKERDEMVAKIMARRNKPTQEAVLSFKKPIVSRFYQEDGEEEEDEEFELPEAPDLDEDSSSDETPESDTEETEETEVTVEDEDGDEEDISLDRFGTDDSDVQNEFDPKDIDALNKLIAAESEAINDYFDASKDTRDENLRTLFSDIGHEERFHLEQLMYAKSQLTGEKYEPRDPEVKAEYEELINGGMDEETAAYTAMDKRSMLGEDDETDSDMEELEQESAMLTQSLYQNEVLSYICEHYQDTPNMNKDIAVFIEGYVMESIDNVSSAPRKDIEIKSPFKVLAQGLKIAIDGLTKMSALARDSMRKSNLKKARRKQWLQNHSIADLFKSGIHLYLYNDNENRMDLDTPCRYVDFLYRLTKAVGETCGVKLTAAAQHKTIKNPIKFTNVKEGMYKLSQVVFNKTKVVVTDNNKDALAREFFGYSNEKIPVKVNHGTDQSVNDSANIYNRLDAVILVTKKYAEVSDAVLVELEKLEGNVNSVYYKNRAVYNAARENMTKIVEKYKQFITAMSSDLTQILKLDNGLLKMTRERDMTEQSGGKWEGEDIRVSKPAGNTNPKYTKTKQK